MSNSKIFFFFFSPKREGWKGGEKKKTKQRTKQCYQLFHADLKSVSKMLQEVKVTNSWQNYVSGVWCQVSRSLIHSEKNRTQLFTGDTDCHLSLARGRRNGALGNPPPPPAPGLKHPAFLYNGRFERERNEMPVSWNADFFFVSPLPQTSHPPAVRHWEIRSTEGSELSRYAATPGSAPRQRRYLCLLGW